MEYERRPVVGWEDLYEVDTDGNVWNKHFNRKLRGNVCEKTGYLRVNLSKDGKCTTRYVHRLIGDAFLEKTDSSLEIHHIDHNKLNNSVENLKWVTHQENLAEEVGRSKAGRQVLCVELNKVYNSMGEAAAATGASAQGICNVLHGRAKTAGKYHWKEV